MNIGQLDFTLLKRPLIIFSLVLVIIVSSVITINLMVSEINLEITEISQTLDSVNSQLYQRQADINLYNNNHQKYSKLSGFSYHQADKLRWLEQIQKQAKSLDLPSMTYNIKARQTAEKFNDLITGDYAVFTTEIDLQLGLVHEGQLLQLVDNLRKSDLGVFSIEACSIVSNGNNEQYQTGRANITVNCSIKWYEIDKSAIGGLGFDPGGAP